MRAIFIDAENAQVVEKEFEQADSLKFLQGCVEGVITTAHRLENDDVYVNDEGMGIFVYGFEFKGAHQPFWGNGVVVGYDDEGRTVSAHSSLEEIKKAVSFLLYCGE